MAVNDAGSHVMGLPRWFVRLALASQMYAFLLVSLVAMTSRPWWRMALWLCAGVGILCGMLMVAALTDPKRRP